MRRITTIVSCLLVVGMFALQPVIASPPKDGHNVVSTIKQYEPTLVASFESVTVLSSYETALQVQLAPKADVVIKRDVVIPQRLPVKKVNVVDPVGWEHSLAGFPIGGNEYEDWLVELSHWLFG